MPIKLELLPDELLSTTRAVRKRLDLSRPVEREVIEECLALATQAPNGQNRERWDFVVVTDKAKRAKIADLYRDGLLSPTQDTGHDGTDRRPDLTAFLARNGPSGNYLFEHLHEVPVLLIPCANVVRAPNPPVVHQANAWGSVLPATWSFMLAARSRGLGTVWTTPHLQYEREAAEILSIPYESVMQMALIPVAYTIGTEFRPGPRANLSQIVHWDTW
jgi:nitroreductase